MSERPVPIPKCAAKRRALADEAGLTDEEREAVEAWCRLQDLRSIDDLLTPSERAELNADLAEMARLRRRSEAESAFLWMP